MLDKVAKLHSLWIKCCINFGCNYQDAQDIVQEMYLKISKIENKDKFRYGKDDINKYYIYMTLKNLFIDIKRKKLLTESLLLNDELDLPEDANYDYARDAALEDIINDIRKDLSKKDQFIQKLFELYYRVPINSNVSYFSKEKLSQQKISDDANVTKYSVSEKLKKLKKELRIKYKEDIEDFFNGDYDKL